jgi:predicted small lipoprotein YifL
MSRILALLCFVALAGCGVQGDLYRPSEPKPDPRKREREQQTHPFPQQQPEEQGIMPDMY